ncbi:MAG: ATPase [Geobacteraceae bacterium]
MEQLGFRLVQEGLITEAELEQALERQRQQGGRVGQNLIALGFLTEIDLAAFFKKYPLPPQTVEETGLDIAFLTDLILKHILFMGEFKLTDVAERVKLSLSVIDKVMETLRRDKLVEVKGGTGYATMTYTFKITETGKTLGMERLDLCRYVGPAPLTLDDYRDMVEVQTIKSAIISEETVHRAFSHLIISDIILKRVGPAVSSGRAIFLYGPPGNGKTAIAETIGRLLPDTVFIPYAITVGGQIISVFDPVNHVQVKADNPTDSIDQRWVLIQRPVVMTGGELVLRMLDLDFNPISKFYEASLQMKANNGLFVVDDFGRQQIEPQHLLNRWIVPLDRGIDFMTLHTGMKFSIPFDMLVIFSTNLEPKQLVDEAFLRRIQYKIKIDHPTEDQYKEIFKRVCTSTGTAFKQEILDYLVTNYYKRLGINFNACHPRDIIEHIVVNSRYYQHSPELTRESIDAAWLTYFVEI